MTMMQFIYLSIHQQINICVVPIFLAIKTKLLWTFPGTSWCGRVSFLVAKSLADNGWAIWECVFSSMSPPP